MTAEEIKNTIGQIFQKTNRQAPLEDKPLSAELDSLALMMFIYEVEQAFSVKFGLADLDEKLTLGRLIELIASKKQD